MSTRGGQKKCRKFVRISADPGWLFVKHRIGRRPDIKHDRRVRIPYLMNQSSLPNRKPLLVCSVSNWPRVLFNTFKTSLPALICAAGDPSGPRLTGWFRSLRSVRWACCALVVAVAPLSHAGLRFNGTDSYAVIPSGSYLDGATVADFTIEFWVKDEQSEVFHTYFSKTEFWKEWTVGLGNGGDVGFVHAWPNNYYGLSTTNNVIKADQWQHVAIVGKGTLGSIYVDGMLVARENSLRGEISFNGVATGSAVAPMAFGFRDNTTLPDDGWFKGVLADVRIWDVALSDSEVAAIVDNPGALGGHGLRHWFPFNEGGGAIFTDVVGGLQGQVYGATWTSDHPRPSDGLIAFYPLNGDALDYSGNGYDGVPSNTVAGTDRFGFAGRALKFNGATSELSVPDPIVQVWDDFTITLWFKLTDASLTYQPLVFTPGPGLGLMYNDPTVPNAINWSVGNGMGPGWMVSYQAGEKSDYEDGRWYQLVFQRDGDYFRMFVDGQIDSEVLVVGDLEVSRGLDFGFLAGQPSRLNGGLDDVRVYNRALSMMEIQGLHQRESSRFNAGLVAHYTFDEGAMDQSGLGNHGIVVNAETGPDRFGVPNTALSFNGTNAHVKIPNSPSLESLDVVTVSAWVNYDAMTPGPYGNNIIGKVGSSGPPSWNLSIVPTGQLRPHGNIGLWSYFDCETVLNAGEWHHVAMVFDGAKLRGFVNGRPDGEMDRPGELTAAIDPVRIGVYSETLESDASMFFDGRIDDVRIYDRALSNQEVLELYGLEAGLTPVIVTHPVAQRSSPETAALQLWIAAEGEAPLAVQWFRDGEIVPAGTNLVLTIANVGPQDAGQYTAVVTNVYGAAISSPAQLTVFPPEPPGLMGAPLRNPANGHVYQLLEPATWVEAQMAAVALGGHLVTIRSQAEQDWIYEHFLEPLGNHDWNGPYGMLNGLIDRDPYNNSANTDLRRLEFEWVSGEPVTYTYWHESEPNNGTFNGAFTGEYYGHMFRSYPGISGPYRWNDLFGSRDTLGLAEIVPPPAVIVGPVNQIVAEGGQVILSAEITGALPLAYQWRKDGIDVPGATGPSLTIEMAGSGDVGVYKLFASNRVGTVTTAGVRLDVLEPVNITSQPAPTSVAQGGTAHFTVSATGGGVLQYQWQRDGVSIPGATGAMMTVNNAQPTDDAEYRVVVSNEASSVASSGARLLVVPTLPSLAVALDAPGYHWTTGGVAPWLPQTEVTADGVDAAVSGRIGDMQETWVQTVINGPGQLSFKWKTSSETGFDRLTLAMNGLKTVSISGEIDWRTQEIAVLEGTHTVRWTYAKDGSESAGADRAWLDQVVFTPEAGVVQPVHLLNPRVRAWDGLFQFDVIGEPGRSVAVEAGPEPGNWTPVSTIATQAGEVRFVDPNPAAATGRFYRLRIIEAPAATPETDD
jgi:hypothetical protein